jgi:hypothetical protein
MDAFRWITVALSMILGLGVTRLLSAFIAIFRSRTHAQLDWVPLAWAACIFMWQLQFWWAIIELPNLMQTWTFTAFLTLVGLTLLLFIAAALVLPPHELREKENLADFFQRDGRWALIALSTYFILAFFVDWRFWHVPLFSYLCLFMVLLIILPCVYIFIRTRFIQQAITGIYIGLSLISIAYFSPAAYP